MNAIPTYQLSRGISVVLHKVIGRRGDGTAERIGRQSARLDLTPYLGDGSTISTSKSIYAPLGSFVLTLIDRPEPAPALDTLYARIEPMDLIEIRFAREPHGYDASLGQGAGLPIIMRGFVRSVRRVQSMDDGGRPHRQVQISGADMGLLFNNATLHYLAQTLTGQLISDRFRAYQIFNTKERAMTAGEFIGTVARYVRDEYLRPLFAQAPAPLGFTLREDLTVTEGTVVWALIDKYSGPLWQLMEIHADRPWNELFIEDREDAPYLVYRPTPFRDIDGNYIDPSAEQAQLGRQIGTTVPIEDVTEFSVERDERHLANFYFLRSYEMELLGYNFMLDFAFREGNGNLFFQQDHPNNDPDLYGVRQMEARIAHAHDGAPAHLNGLPEQRLREMEPDILEWQLKRTRLLRAMNEDNVVFETGSATIKGNERIRPGRYLTIDHGRFAADYYVTGVTHSWTVFGSFTTTVQLIRGTGFVERIKLNESPYWLEGRGGLYR